MKNNKGFTLAELLIVVAIIAVLTGVSIPVFNGQLEKSRESKDLANVRSAYAELMAAVLTQDDEATYNNVAIKVDDNTYVVAVELTQSKNDWQGHSDMVVAGVSSDDTEHWKGKPRAKGLCTVVYTLEDNAVVFNWDGNNIASNLTLAQGSWNKKGTYDTNRINKIVRTYNNGESKYPGLYELESDTTYRVTVTYNPALDNLENPTKGIVAKATQIYDSNGINVTDTGTAKFVMNQESQKDIVTYKYITNDDGTVTYTATFKTDNKSDKYYYGMNFGAMAIKDYSTGELDTNSALNFVGKTSDSNTLGMTNDQYNAFINQILNDFIIEKVN